MLLQEKIELPSDAIRNNVASLSDLTNVLANYALSSGERTMEGGNNDEDSASHSFHMHELLEQIPPLQYGMDVNPKFTAGIHGYEYTAQLHCFDTWHVSLCHGWLLDPHETSEDLFAAIGQKTYNEVIDLVIQGNEAEQVTLPALEKAIQAEKEAASATATSTPVDLLDDDTDGENKAPTNKNTKLAELEKQKQEAAHKATIGSWIDHFLHETGHQLTQYGLHCLHQDLKEGELGVFFRNNHFSSITKQDGLLYLLVTDLGYANTPQIVWEKLDMINGDTEYVNSVFKTVGQVSMDNNRYTVVAADPNLSPEALLAQSGQKDADYQLALHLSMNANNDNNNNTNDANASSSLDAREGELMAAATEASLREYHGTASSSNSQTVATTASTGSGNPEVAMGVPLTNTAGGGGGGGTVAALPPSYSSGTGNNSNMADPDHLLALQMANEQDPQPFVTDDMASLRLAQQLQAEEDQRAAAETGRRRPTTTTRRPADSSSSKCVIS